MADPRTAPVGAPPGHAPGSQRRGLRRGRVLGVVLAILLALAVLYLFAPAITVCILRHDLPVMGQAVEVDMVSTAPLDAPAAISCRLSPEDARRILSGCSGYWLPPWYLRSGQSAAGIITDEDADPVTRLPWVVQVVGRGELPALDIRLSSSQLAALTTPYRDLTLGPMTATWQVSRVEVGEDPGRAGSSQSWFIVAVGSMHLAFNSWESDVAVHQLQAVVTLTMRAVPAGWAPQLSLAITRLDVDPQAGILASPATRHQLEQVISTRINAALAKLTLPRWVPPRFWLLMSIRPDPKATAALAPHAARP